MDDLKLGVILAQIINFGILFFIFKYFLGEKIVAAIEERRNQLKASEEAEDKAQEKIEEAQKEAEKIVDEARVKAGEIEKSAEELSKNNTAKSIAQAEKEAKYIIESAREETEKQKLDMVNSMRSKVLDLSLKLNSKIFKKEVANKDFLEKELDVLTK